MLSTAARFGPYFTWQERSPSPAWQPWSALADAEVALSRVEAARTALCGMFGLDPDVVPLRVVASVTFLGWASRVVSPLLGAAVLSGSVPSVSLFWQPVPGGPLPVAYVETGPGASLYDVSMDLLDPIVSCFRARFRLSPQVLHGNIASALNGAATVIAQHSPSLAAPARALVAATLGKGTLAGTATLTPSFRRNNCCLYYRIPGGGTCGDCVLNR